LADDKAQEMKRVIIVTLTSIGKHAIVIGAGIGGLAAAAAVGSHFEHVTIVERETAPG